MFVFLSDSDIAWLDLTTCYKKINISFCILIKCTSKMLGAKSVMSKKCDF